MLDMNFWILLTLMAVIAAADADPSKRQWCQVDIDDGLYYDLAIEVCCGMKVHRIAHIVQDTPYWHCCGGKLIDLERFTCCNGHIHVNNIHRQCCGNVTYDTRFKTCCKSDTYPNPVQILPKLDNHSCCADKQFDLKTEKCGPNFEIMKKQCTGDNCCGGQPMYRSQICCDGQLFAKRDHDNDKCCRNGYGEITPYNSQTHECHSECPASVIPKHEPSKGEFYCCHLNKWVNRVMDCESQNHVKKVQVMCGDYEIENEDEQGCCNQKVYLKKMFICCNGIISSHLICKDLGSDQSPKPRKKECLPRFTKDFTEKKLNNWMRKKKHMCTGKITTQVITSKGISLKMRNARCYDENGRRTVKRSGIRVTLPRKCNQKLQRRMLDGRFIFFTNNPPKHTSLEIDEKDIFVQIYKDDRSIVRKFFRTLRKKGT